MCMMDTQFFAPTREQTIKEYFAFRWLRSEPIQTLRHNAIQTTKMHKVMFLPMHIECGAIKFKDYMSTKKIICIAFSKRAQPLKHCGNIIIPAPHHRMLPLKQVCKPEERDSSSGPAVGNPCLYCPLLGDP
ncbi:hypothetical protein CUU80_04805 [Bifidobacterium scaligerum]|uniref:Uncharacterized protein n=1 Tax=Bifidobacterium scaligerum TaxID=2052656 RepID=A0A2M9HRA9_9BIFI|nr:hypothetical protein CUU80_04805 [Bifidobacterium scaligerum]